MRWPKPLLRKNPRVHKKDFGHVLVVAGSAPMLGAAALVSLAAMRSGAGLVTCAIPAALNLALQKKISPIIMTLPFKSYQDIKKQLHRFDVLAIGPGLGQSPSVTRLVQHLILDFKKPMVIDADALNIIARDPKILKRIKSPKVLTPHEGEMARLISCTKEKTIKNRIKVAEEFAKKYTCITVLKGHQTIIADTQGKIVINKTGNAHMATAGSGDVLTGIISAFLAQGIGPFESTRLGCHIHGLAGDLSARKIKFGMIAMDIITYLNEAFMKSSHA